jgi:hypothetical protein
MSLSTFEQQYNKTIQLALEVVELKSDKPLVQFLGKVYRVTSGKYVGYECVESTSKFESRAKLTSKGYSYIPLYDLIVYQKVGDVSVEFTHSVDRISSRPSGKNFNATFNLDAIEHK